MCETKLHGAKRDGPVVAGLLFFAKRWRTKFTETIIRDRSGLFNFVSLLLD